MTRFATARLGNPEFRRNLMVEISPQRLLGMPVVLGLLFLAGAEAGGAETVDVIAHGALVVLLLLWGTRLTAGAVADEIQAGTWDAQRMSGLSPWAMTWGKLFGVTAFMWYGAAFAVAAIWIAGITGMVELLDLLLTGVVAQAGALLFGLLLQRVRRTGGKRLGVALAQIFAIGLAVWLTTQESLWEARPVEWWSLTVDGRDFILLSKALALGWVLAGIHALMREELRYRAQPWTWLAFLAFCAVYVAGFGDELLVVSLFGTMLAVDAVPLVIMIGTVAGLTLVAALLGMHNSVEMRRWLAGPTRARSRPGALLTEAPAWGLGLAVTLLLGLVLTVIWLRVPEPSWLPVLIWSGGLFLLRDVGVILALNLDSGARRGPWAGLIYLWALYILVPVALVNVSPGASAAVMPTVAPTVFGALIPALGQAALAWLLVAWRWRVAKRGLSTAKPG
ncbi:hypothetical protein HNR56_002968 [Roseospira marina]|nr:hypothetical protein [Roseospira marina]MBB5088263.1 hypothetical protein [Roseospira marina]